MVRAQWSDVEITKLKQLAKQGKVAKEIQEDSTFRVLQTKENRLIYSVAQVSQSVSRIPSLFAQERNSVSDPF